MKREEGMEKPFPQEQELAEKSARLAELNTALDREEKDGGKDADEEKEEKQETWADPGTRLSILKALKGYEPPALASSGAGRRMEREAVG